MNVIDAHHHGWGLSVRDQDWITGPEMAPIRRSFSLDDLRPDARAADVAAAGLRYDLVLRPHQLPAATHAAAAVPELTMVLDHAAKPPIATGDLGPWTEAIRAFAARPNAVCELSGLVPEAAPGAPESAFVPVADAILSAFGPHRVMSGSVWPGHWRAGGLAEAERTAVLASTAARVYRMDVSVRSAAAAEGGTWLLPTRRSRKSSR